MVTNFVLGRLRSTLLEPSYCSIDSADKINLYGCLKSYKKSRVYGWYRLAHTPSPKHVSFTLTSYLQTPTF
jgi:hypothetical protein